MIINGPKVIVLSPVRGYESPGFNKALERFVLDAYGDGHVAAEFLTVDRDLDFTVAETFSWVKHLIDIAKGLAVTGGHFVIDAGRFPNTAQRLGREISNKILYPLCGR